MVKGSAVQVISPGFCCPWEKKAFALVTFLTNQTTATGAQFKGRLRQTLMEKQREKPLSLPLLTDHTQCRQHNRTWFDVDLHQPPTCPGCHTEKVISLFETGTTWRTTTGWVRQEEQKLNWWARQPDFHQYYFYRRIELIKVKTIYKKLEVKQKSLEDMSVIVLIGTFTAHWKRSSLKISYF